MMRKHNFIAAAIVALLSAVAMVSCSDDDKDEWYYPAGLPNAIVTVKPVADKDSFYMQLDDSTRLLPLNIRKSPYGDKEVRAFINFSYAEQPGNTRDFKVYINWMDSILTKTMSPDLGSTENISKYGQDPVELLRNWTVSEDGYLTLNFMTKGGQGTVHYVNLVASNPSNPYEVTFYHKLEGYGYDSREAQGVVAFRLDKLPDTGGKTVDLTVRWKSYEGDKTTTFKYTTRKASKAGELRPGEYMKNVR